MATSSWQVTITHDGNLLNSFTSVPLEADHAERLVLPDHSSATVHLSSSALPSDGSLFAIWASAYDANLSWTLPPGGVTRILDEPVLAVGKASWNGLGLGGNQEMLITNNTNGAVEVFFYWAVPQ